MIDFGRVVVVMVEDEEEREWGGGGVVYFYHGRLSEIEGRLKKKKSS